MLRIALVGLATDKQAESSELNEEQPEDDNFPAPMHLCVRRSFQWRRGIHFHTERT
jgi:hypothetical protein